jgi:hypothetical protein
MSIDGATVVGDSYPMPVLTNQVPIECRRPPKEFAFS